MEECLANASGYCVAMALVLHNDGFIMGGQSFLTMQKAQLQAVLGSCLASLCQSLSCNCSESAIMVCVRKFLNIGGPSEVLFLNSMPLGGICSRATGTPMFRNSCTKPSRDLETCLFSLAVRHETSCPFFSSCACRPRSLSSCSCPSLSLSRCPWPSQLLMPSLALG